jgi:hypothetical protein
MVRPIWIMKLGRRRLPVTESRLMRVRLSGGVIIAVSIIGLALLFSAEFAWVHGSHCQNSATTPADVAPAKQPAALRGSRLPLCHTLASFELLWGD